MHVTAEMHLEPLWYVKEARHKGHIWFHLYGMCRTGKLRETENRSVGDQDWKKGGMGSEIFFFFLSNESVLQLDNGNDCTAL